MVDRFLGPIALHRLLFLVLASVIFYLRLLPLQPNFGTWPGPDVLLCLVFCWTQRRPDFLPFWLVAIVIFIEDLLMMRPPGLWAALVVGGSEFLRTRAPITRELNFGVEWVLVAVMILGLGLLNRLVFAFTLLPQVPFDAALLQLFASILAYPVVVGLSVLGFGLRKPALGELDSAVRRI